MADVGIAFVGAGRMGQAAHLRHYASLEGCEVVALADPRRRTAELVASRYGVPKTYGDHREMLETERPDAVVAILPFNLHATVVPDLYPTVGYVLTEKPLAVSVEAGERLVAAAREAGCVHMVGYNKRSDPATALARETAQQWRASGRMGALRYVRITMPPGDWIQGGFQGVLDAGDPRPETPAEPPPPDMDEATGRQYVSFVNYYIHQVNLLRYLLGEPYRTSYAESSGALLAATSESGVAAAIEMAPYRTSRGWEESALVAFEKGCLRLSLAAPLACNRAGTVEVYEDPGQGEEPARFRPTLPPVGSMQQQAVNFLRVCRGEAEAPCDAAEALEDLKVARDYVLKRFARS